VNNAPSTPEAKAQEEKRRQLSKLLGEIEKRITQENERPKNAISARLRAKKSMPFITTNCVRKLKQGEQPTSPKPLARSYTEN
jgi:hypothetical protein